MNLIRCRGWPPRDEPDCWLSFYFLRWNFNRLTLRPRCLLSIDPRFPSHLSVWLLWTLILLNHHESSIKMWPKKKKKLRANSVGICGQVWLWGRKSCLRFHFFFLFFFLCPSTVVLSLPWSPCSEEKQKNWRLSLLLGVRNVLEHGHLNVWLCP